MAREERAIFTNMCMIEDGEGRVLIQDRKDPNWPGYTFPGGHVEPGESFVGSVIREVWEETGLTIEHPTLCGIKQFQTKEGARYLVLFTRPTAFPEHSLLPMKERCSGCPGKSWITAHWLRTLPKCSRSLRTTRSVSSIICLAIKNGTLSCFNRT